MDKSSDTSFLSICKEYQHCAEAIQDIEFNMIEGYLKQIMNILSLEQAFHEGGAANTSASAKAMEDLKSSARATIEEITKNLNAKVAGATNSATETAIEQDEAVLAQAVTNNLVAMIYAQDEALKETHTVMTAALTQALSQLLTPQS